MITTHPFYLTPDTAGKNILGDYLADDEEDDALRNPHTLGPGWGIGRASEHPSPESGGGADEDAPGAPNCAVRFIASHGPLAHADRDPRRTIGVVSYGGGLRSARFSSGF